MSEAWKSTEKHYCKICQCWLSGHKRNVLAHERSDRHQNNLARGMSNMKRKERDAEEHEKLLAKELRNMEKAAEAHKRGHLRGPANAALRYVPTVSRPGQSNHNPMIGPTLPGHAGPMSNISANEPMSTGAYGDAQTAMSTGAPVVNMDDELSANAFSQLAASGGVSGSGNFDMDEFDYVPANEALATESSANKADSAFAPSFRFNVPSSFEVAPSVKEQYEAIVKANKAPGTSKPEPEPEPVTPIEEATPTPVPKYEGPKFNFDIPDDYQPPPATFFESTVVAIVDGEFEEMKKPSHSVPEEVATSIRSRQGMASEITTGAWSAGDVEAFIKLKQQRVVGDTTVINDGAPVPKAVKLSAEERLQILQNTNAESALKYQLEMETLGDRAELYRDKLLVADGKVSLAGDAGHLNKSDMTTVKKKFVVESGTKKTGFKKRAVKPVETKIKLEENLGLNTQGVKRDAAISCKEETN